MTARKKTTKKKIVKKRVVRKKTTPAKAKAKPPRKKANANANTEEEEQGAPEYAFSQYQDEEQDSPPAKEQDQEDKATSEGSTKGKSGSPSSPGRQIAYREGKKPHVYGKRQRGYSPRSRQPVPAEIRATHLAFQNADPEWPSWCAEFLYYLGEEHAVTQAAKAVGRTRSNVYRYRQTSESFKAAWEDVVHASNDQLVASCMKRSIHGTREPILFQGQVVAVKTVHETALSIFMLKKRCPDEYGDHAFGPAEDEAGRASAYKRAQAEFAPGEYDEGDQFL